MCSLIPKDTVTILEPTAGNGNILSHLIDFNVTAPVNYFEMPKNRFDCIIMNPPFSLKYTYGVPDHYKEKGMKIGYRILFECMEMSDHVIALMPWFLLLDSTQRLTFLKTFGLKSITALPRSTFDYARIQCAVFELSKGFNGDTIFKQFHFTKETQTKINI